MMSLCIGLNFHPRLTDSDASQSSNSGCVGGTPNLPKSFALATMPRPKWCCQIRLTITRAVTGLSFDAIQFARTERRPLLRAPAGGSGILGSGAPRTCGKPGSTLALGAWALPRIITNVCGGRVKQLLTDRA